MLFHTWTFLFFFLIVFGGYLALRPTRLWTSWLLLASYVFYGWWNPFYLLLIVYSTVLDFGVVAMMDRQQPGSSNRRHWLIVSIVNNLTLLAFFKYADFLIENLNALGANFPEASRLMPFGLEYLLPVGISFYTFQSLSYTLDFYRGTIKRERSFVRFATFVTFFPQLVAGPIERSKNLLPQFRHAPRITTQHLTDGLSLFLVGLFKKLALANYLALYVDLVYSAPGDHNSIALLFATICFAWQIYFDFSGYTDMARGIARMMGFNLMLNFNHPYLATGLGDFWSRWHISLSTWFRDYLYLPLGGNRRGELITCRNLLIVFLASALWHGAAWHFIVWGALHAVGIILTRTLERSTWYREHLPDTIKRLWVFAFVCLAWIFFRAETVGEAWLIVTRICTLDGAHPTTWPLPLGWLVLAAFAYQLSSLTAPTRRFVTSSPVRIATATCMLILLVFYSSSGGAFIYFQF
ncbi:MAG: MBOAT family protein [Roseibacillus sp.]|nr:MBOAT family protein [Roseibacillus sp.]